MSWLILALAGGVEIAWSQSIKPTDGFTRLLPTIVCVLVGAFVVGPDRYRNDPQGH